MYCDRALWEQAPAPQAHPKPSTDAILELPGADTPEEVPSKTATPHQNSPALPKRATPRLKGVARREHILSQSVMDERLAGGKWCASAIVPAREQLISNYMARTKTRTAHKAAAVGDSHACPERGREFCTIWIFGVLNMGARFSEGAVLVTS